MLAEHVDVRRRPGRVSGDEVPEVCPCLFVAGLLDLTGEVEVVPADDAVYRVKTRSEEFCPAGLSAANICSSALLAVIGKFVRDTEDGGI